MKKKTERQQIMQLVSDSSEEVVEYLIQNKYDFMRFLEKRKKLSNSDKYQTSITNAGGISEIQKNVFSELNISEIVTTYLHNLGVPRNLAGFNYLHDAIIIWGELENDKFIKITKEIYPDIAKKYKTTCSSVERAMHHAIQTRINISDLKNIYGYVLPEKEKITNSEFVAISAYIVKMLNASTVQEVEEAEKVEEKVLSETDLLVETTRYLQLMAVPRNIKGFLYLREAIIICINYNDIPVMKILYPQVADKFKTTSIKVERDIRHAIQVAFERVEEDVSLEIFGYTYSSEKGRPTNSEFIAMIADLVKNGK